VKTVYANGQTEGETYWFEVPLPYAKFLSCAGNPWLLTLLPLAMLLGEPLQTCVPVDRVLLSNALGAMRV